MLVGSGNGWIVFRMSTQLYNISDMKLVRTYGRGEPFACFDCRKSFKRNVIGYLYFDNNGKKRSPDFHKKWQHESRPCPDCQKPAYYMGIDFKPPRTSDIRGWKKVEAFILSGKHYYRGSQMPENIKEAACGFSQRRELFRKHKL
jgi:hypothetical protein